MKKHKKEICWSCTIILALTIFLFFFLIGCQDTEFKEIKDIPKPEAASDKIDKTTISRHFAYNRSFNWVKTKVPDNIKVLLLDNHYDSVDYYFFKKFNSWFKDLQFENGILPVSPKENLDCDNFAMLYKSLISVAGYKSKSKYEPAVALLVLRQVNEFGGVPSGGLHMVNLVFTNRGWYILEPQTGSYILLEDYPNQEHVIYMIL